MINEINFRFNGIFSYRKRFIWFVALLWISIIAIGTNGLMSYILWKGKKGENILFCLPQQGVIAETRCNKIYNIFFVNKLPIFFWLTMQSYAGVSSDESVSLRLTILHVLTFSAAFRAEYRWCAENWVEISHCFSLWWNMQDVWVSWPVN